MAGFLGDLEIIKPIAVTWYWDDKIFQGKNWTPTLKEHCYLFFKEK
jgi:hypothetical protein